MKRYLAIALSILVAVILGWHFIAGNQAERQIDKAIQEEAAKPESTFSIEYELIDISPFSGDISLKNLTIIGDSVMVRSAGVHIDLRYEDFIDFYLWGIETGLRNIENSQMKWISTSYLNRLTLDEYKADTLLITYHGNALEILRHFFGGGDVSDSQSIAFSAKKLLINRPGTFLGKLNIKNAEAEASFPVGNGKGLWSRGNYEAAFDSIKWSPPNTFREKYRFFIQGFGYTGESIPIHSSVLQATPVDGPAQALSIQNSQLLTELATLSLEGRIIPGNTFTSTTLDTLDLVLYNLSPKFLNVVKNFEKLMNRRLVNPDNELQFRLTGTVHNPRIDLR